MRLCPISVRFKGKGHVLYGEKGKEAGKRVLGYGRVHGYRDEKSHRMASVETFVATLNGFVSQRKKRDRRT